MNSAEAFAVVTTALTEIAPNLDVAALDRHAELLRFADLDSLDVLSLAQEIAERTGVQIPDSARDQVRTLDGLAHYLVAHSGGAPG